MALGFLSAASIALASAPAQDPSPGPSGVVVALPSKAAFPPGARPLGKGKGWAWSLIPLEAAPALAAAPAAEARLAWLDAQSYQASLAGLSKAEQAAAVGKRAKAQGEVLSELAEDLARAAGRLAALAQGPSDSLFAIFTAGHRLRRVTGTPSEELLLALQDRALIDACERALAGLVPGSPFDTALSALTRQTLTRAVIALGDSSLEKAPYTPRLIQGYFLRGKQTLLQDAIEKREIAAEKLPGGWLALLDPDQAKASGSPLLVFATAEEYYRSLRLDTPPQRQARVAAAAKRGGPSVSEFEEARDAERLALLARMETILAAANPSATALNPSSAAQGPIDASPNSSSPGLGLPATVRDALRSAFAEERKRLGADPAEGPATGSAASAGSSGNAGSAATAFDQSLNALRRRFEILAAFAARTGDKDIAAWAAQSAATLRANASLPGKASPP